MKTQQGNRLVWMVAVVSSVCAVALVLTFRARHTPSGDPAGRTASAVIGSATVLPVGESARRTVASPPDSAPASVQHVASEPVSQEPAPVSATVVPVQPAGAEERIRQALASLPSSARRYTDTSIPLSQREEEIRAMGRRKNAEAIQTLMALGNAPVYLNRAAVEALGNIRTPEVAEYLRQKVADPQTLDVTLLCEAVKSLAKVSGEDAVPAIGKVLEIAWTRQDGMEMRQAQGCVVALALVSSQSSLTALGGELDRVVKGCEQPVGKQWPPLIYGQEVVDAIGRGWHTDAAASLIEGYAAGLEQRIPEDKFPRGHFEECIASARTAAAKIATGGL